MAEPHDDPQDNSDNAYALDGDLIEAIRDAVEAGDRTAMLALLEDLHAADIADMLEQIGAGERRDFLTLWHKDLDGDVLSELSDRVRDEVLDYLPREVLADAVRDLETDDVVDLIEDMEGPQQAMLLGALEDADRVAVQQALTYPEETAGRLMQRELVMAPTHWNVGQAIDYLREQTDLPEQFYHVMIVDPLMRPVGQVPLGTLLASRRAVALAAIMEDDFRTIPVLQDEEDVAYAFNQYHMVSAPVVDASGRLVGVITIDDAMSLLGESADEDIKRLAGVSDEESLTDRVIATTRQRFPWLAVNLVTAILASLVIAQFEATIHAIVALAVLMPIIASMGGNAGTQTLTVTVRAIATKDLTRANVWRVIRREALVGLANGFIFAVMIAVVGIIWFGSPMLAVVLALAMVANHIVAGLAGVLIPIGLEKLGVDPALASGAFVTTVTDIVGFFAFLGLAAVMLL
ncbi:MAG: magnesium transporter [Rhodobacteraceae bacterium]|nr:magnesium transporter [Paracoccaceae bacterium]